jgi:hypothetical protein
MLDHRMLGIPNQPDRPVVEIPLPPGWGRDLEISPRVADVGAPVLTYVTVYSAVEAAAVNARYRQHAEQALQANLAAKGPEYLARHLDELAVQGAAQVDRLLDAIRQQGYFSSWVLVESCTID